MFTPIIAGHAVSAQGRDTLPIQNPATGALCAEFICATLQDADTAADAASRAFPEWATTAPAERAQALRRIARAVEAASEGIAAQITLEQGKPLAEATLEMSGVVAMYDFFADTTESFAFTTHQNGHGARRQIDMTPTGPVIVITTWNFPVETAAVHMAPALAAGCPVLVLANGDTPSSVAMLVEVIAGCDLPAGTVNLLMGHAPGLSAHLIKHPAIRHLSYTGSVDVGRVLAAQCGAEIMRCTLELGGNAPAIVLPGTDIDAAAKALISKRFWNAGQVCTAPNRIYVNRAQHDAFAEAAGACVRALRLGDGAVEGTTMGPLINTNRVDAMDRIAADAIANGATVVLNDPAPQTPGSFAPPRVFANVPDAALGMSHEIFGPIACLAPYDDLDNIVERSNNCDLGLSGYVYGPDQTEAEAAAARLHVGSVAVNQLTTAYIDVPFGGMKHSGLGTVGGSSALAEYLFPRLTASAS